MQRIDKIVFSVIAALILAFLLGNGNYIYNILIIVNSFLSIYYALDRPTESYSLQKVTNIFILVFFVVALGIQFKDNNIVSSLFVNYYKEDYIAFQFLLLIIIIVYNGSVGIFRSRRLHQPDYIQVRYLPKEGLLIVLSFLAFILIFDSFNFNVIGLLFRGLANDSIQTSSSSSSLSLIISHFIRPIPAVCFMIAYITKAKKSCLWITFLLTIISNFPTGMARNSVAMIWLPIVLLVFNKFFRRKNSFALLMLLAYFFVLPFMDNFRYFNGKISWNFSFDYFNTMNFDAGQNFMFAIKNNVITWGRQLLGVLLFFVPRSIWPNKPIGSGAYLASTQPGSFSNIAFPFFGEGYINFGYLGTFIFTIILAYFSARLDKKFWAKMSYGIDINYGMYLILVGALTFILRGDLMSSFAYTVGICLSYYLVEKVCVKEVK